MKMIWQYLAVSKSTLLLTGKKRGRNGYQEKENKYIFNGSNIVNCNVVL